MKPTMSTNDWFVHSNTPRKAMYRAARRNMVKNMRPRRPQSVFHSIREIGGGRHINGSCHSLAPWLVGGDRSNGVGSLVGTNDEPR
jgi:hypothetical protein